MSTLVSVVKAALIPGSIPFLATSLLLGTLLLYGGEVVRKWGRRWVAFLVIFYWTLSVPVTADAVATMLAGEYRPLASAADAPDVSAIIVLDGGTSRFRARGLALDAPNTLSALRALEAIRVYRLLGAQLVVVTAGAEEPDGTTTEGAALREAIVRGGIPTERIILDSESPTTRNHALTLASLLQPRGIRRVVLVTSPSHIRRAMWSFQAAGFDIIPSPAVAHSEYPLSSWRRWWPSRETLVGSESNFRDALATAYYFARGWL